MTRTIYLVLHSKKAAAPTILGAFAALDDANAQCLAQAAETGFQPLAHAPKTVPGPLRWDAPDGVSCRVEPHPLIMPADRKPEPVAT